MARWPSGLGLELDLRPTAEETAECRAFLEQPVEGPAQEDSVWEHKPIFIVLESVGAFLLWLGFAVAHWHLNGTEGLDSMLGGSGHTLLMLHQDCTDVRWQIWRWWTYQFSHVGFIHVASNFIVNLVLGVPFEGFEGTLRTFTVFNAGVLGAACGHCVWKPHQRLAGMSGGGMALIGAHCTQLGLSWSQSKLRVTKMAVLALLVMTMALEAELSRFLHLDDRGDHSAHVGGFAAGVLSGGAIGRSMRAGSQQQLCLQVACVLAAAASVAACLLWISQWPPRSFWDPVPWCWARQVRNVSYFNDTQWQCARCDSAGCASKWQEWSTPKPLPVSTQMCESTYGWGATGR